jgi:hypothetical protein
MLADVLPVALCPDAVEMLCDNILPFILCMEDDDSQAIIVILINSQLKIFQRIMSQMNTGVGLSS